MESLEATELRLGLPGMQDETEKPSAPPTAGRGSKRALVGEPGEEAAGCRTKGGRAGDGGGANDSEAAPAAKSPVVGWPPIRSYRKSCLQARKAADQAEAPGTYVKVSMDGAPYLRKIDLGTYRGYKDLREALEGLFRCFSLGFSGGEEGCGSPEYALTYEDKDGDWMLAGDVPWEMFSGSCRRLRIMRGYEARGLDTKP